MPDWCQLILGWLWTLHKTGVMVCECLVMLQTCVLAQSRCSHAADMLLFRGEKTVVLCLVDVVCHASRFMLKLFYHLNSRNYCKFLENIYFYGKFYTTWNT